MNETINSQLCERADDLISFLYGELGDRELRSFEQHLRTCNHCESELAAFGHVRRSVQDWRDESLNLAISTFPQTERPQPAIKHSAWAAIRAFFEISPLWMKGASAFAAVLFCVLSLLAITRLYQDPQPLPTPGELHTEEEFRIAVASQANILAQKKIDDEVRIALANDDRVQPRRSINNKPASSPNLAQAPRKTSKPLSRSERNQLAADLRLISDEVYDEDSLHLLGDRINR